MEIELRADGVRITGYVNVTEKKSRPVITPHGRAIEEIEPRAQAPQRRGACHAEHSRHTAPGSGRDDKASV